MMLRMRPARGEVRIKGLFHQLHLMRASTRDAYGDRKTSTVCQVHSASRCKGRYNTTGTAL